MTTPGEALAAVKKAAAQWHNFGPERAAPYPHAGRAARGLLIIVSASPALAELAELALQADDCRNHRLGQFGTHAGQQTCAWCGGPWPCWTSRLQLAADKLAEAVGG